MARRYVSLDELEVRLHALTDYAKLTGRAERQRAMEEVITILDELSYVDLPIERADALITYRYTGERE